MSRIEDLKKALGKKAYNTRKQQNVGYGETAAAGYMERCAKEDPTRTPVCENFAELIKPEIDEFAAAIMDELKDKKYPATRPEFTKKDLWFWGGPTPQWGGSLQPDTLVRNAKYFDAPNGIYVYGPTNEEMIARHSSFNRLLAMVTNTCRAPGQQTETDEECAEKLSLLSLKYPNIAGGMMDDMTNTSKDIDEEKVRQVSCVNKALKKHNPALELFGVVYRHELGRKNFEKLLPWLDGVNLWFWFQNELLEVEQGVEECRKNFPGKKILLGLFLHDYGLSDAGTLPELLIHQLRIAEKLYADGIICGLVILGDRDVLKWPEQAETVRNYLADVK